MTLRQEMQQAARKSRRTLDAGAAASAGDFLRSQMDPCGAWRNRRGKSDLYYTVFGIEASSALGLTLPWDAIERYLLGFGVGAGLDLVHLTCLARAWAACPKRAGEDLALGIAARLELNRCTDGGYNHLGPQEGGSAYGCFLALGAYEDLALAPPGVDGVAACLGGLRCRDGSFANDRRMPLGLATATAAAAMVLARLGQPAPAKLASWLLSCHHAEGGFSALPAGPIPDLLSTATSLHALAAMKVPLDEIALTCREFVRGLQSPAGGFAASMADPAVDCEYTFYGLLALGHLVL